MRLALRHGGGGAGRGRSKASVLSIVNSDAPLGYCRPSFSEARCLMSCPAGLRPSWEAEWSSLNNAHRGWAEGVGGERRHSPSCKILCGRVGKGVGLGVPATAVGPDRFRARPHIHFVDEQIIHTPSHARSCPSRDLGASLLSTLKRNRTSGRFMLFVSRYPNQFGFYSLGERLCFSLL